MPETTDGEMVYSDPTALRRELQVVPDDLGMVENDPPDSENVEDWDTLVDTVQVAAKKWIDRYCKRDFERHDDATVERSVGSDAQRVLRLPSPVRKIREVRVEGDPLDTEGYEFERSGSLVRTGGRRPQVVYHGGARFGRAQRTTWPAGYNNVVVDLDYGPKEPPAEVAAVERALVANTLGGLAERRAETVVATDEFDMETSMNSAVSTELASTLARHRRMEVFN